MMMFDSGLMYHDDIPPEFKNMVLSYNLPAVAFAKMFATGFGTIDPFPGQCIKMVVPI